jgi:hypothetical protein
MNINFETLFKQTEANEEAKGFNKSAYATDLLDLIVSAKADGFSSYDLIETAFLRGGFNAAPEAPEDVVPEAEESAVYDNGTEFTYTEEDQEEQD